MTDNGSGLSRIHYRVTLADGEQLDAHVLNTDLLRWDRTAAKHGWAKFDSIPMTFATFLAWAALRRTGRIGESVTWEAFSDELCADVMAIDAAGNPLADGSEPDAVDPIQPVAGLG